MSKVLQDLADLAKRIREVEKNPEDLEEIEGFLTQQIEYFPKYFGAVVMMQSRMTIMSQFYDREDYADRVQKLDQSRRDLHILAAQAINKVNRLCKSYGLAPMFVFPEKNGMELQPEAKVSGNPMMEMQAENDRELAADAVYGFCKEVFLDSRSLARYNQLEGYSREQRDRELYSIGSENGHFAEIASLDQIIRAAREEVKADKKSPATKFPTERDDQEER